MDVVGGSTYSVFLFGTVVGLADADAEALIVNRLVGALLSRLSALEGKVATHLGRHRGQLEVCRPDVHSDLWLLLRWSPEGRNRQLKGTSSRLRNLLRGLLVASQGGARREQRGQKAWLGRHKLGPDGIESR